MAVASAASRRLRRILNDEDYGPKLVRLSTNDQRVVLDLISENRGREARSAIEELDQRRREEEEERAKNRQFQKVLQVLFALHGPRTQGQVGRISRNASEMTAAQMRRILGLTGQKLRNYVNDHARQPAPAGKTINPFWYR
jgi:hypothetical protein